MSANWEKTTISQFGPRNTWGLARRSRVLRVEFGNLVFPSGEGALMGGFLACDGPLEKPQGSAEICLPGLAPYQQRLPRSGHQFSHPEDGRARQRTSICKEPGGSPVLGADRRPGAPAPDITCGPRRPLGQPHSERPEERGWFTLRPRLEQSRGSHLQGACFPLLAAH